jgi:hypothetical protein
MNPNHPIIISMKYPYDNVSLEETKNIYEKIKHKYKEVPPFELVYASSKNLISLKPKTSVCTLCHRALNGLGIYFPIENNLIIPYACCETCCNKEEKKEVYVGKFLRSLKYYHWKMIIGSNLYDHYYKQVLKEEEEIKKEYEKLVSDQQMNHYMMSPQTFCSLEPIMTDLNYFKEEEEEEEEKHVYMIDYGKEESFDFITNYYNINVNQICEKEEKIMDYKWIYVFFFSIFVSVCSYFIYNIM